MYIFDKNILSRKVGRGNDRIYLNIKITFINDLGNYFNENIIKFTKCKETISYQSL